MDDFLEKFALFGVKGPWDFSRQAHRKGYCPFAACLLCPRRAWLRFVAAAVAGSAAGSFLLCHRPMLSQLAAGAGQRLTRVVFSCKSPRGSKSIHSPSRAVKRPFSLPLAGSTGRGTRPASRPIQLDPGHGPPPRPPALYAAVPFRDSPRGLPRVDSQRLTPRRREVPRHYRAGTPAAMMDSRNEPCMARESAVLRVTGLTSKESLA
jgi:hypothetical protein